jgi:C1A family cysteine protease
MMKAASKQPLSVALNVDMNGFRSYKSGVLSGACSTSTNHEVVIMGYKSDGATPYWLLQNSWGAQWGDKGRIKLAMNNSKDG